MFDLWKLNFKLWRIKRKYFRLGRELEKTGDLDLTKREFLENGFYHETGHLEREVDKILGRDLFHEARRLDVETPPLANKEMWCSSRDGDSLVWLTSKGRAHVRKQIDAEKARRFEVKTLWVTKFWLPLLAALVGILGALTGLVAVLRHTK